MTRWYNNLKLASVSYWYSTLTLVCEKRHHAQYVTTAHCASFCQERCLLLLQHMLGLSCDRSPWLPVGKSPNHSRILVWFPAGSCILSGKEKHVKFSPTLIPREFTLLLGFCNQRPNAIPCAKAIQRRRSSRQLCRRGMIRVCDKHSARPQARPGTNHSRTCSVRNTCT